MTYFFAYGDRMGTGVMAETVPGATLMGPARLPGYRLVFNVMSRAWGGGAANALPDPNGAMWGVLWDLGDDDPMALEPLPRDDEIAHGLLEVTVEGPDGPVRARTLAVSTTGSFVRPTERYLAMLRANAERQGLPEEALAAIDRAAAAPDAGVASI